MRPRLLHPELDVAFEAPAALEAFGVADDLELPVVIDAMAGGDGTIAAVARRLLLDPCPDTVVIRHRQAVMRACLTHPDTARSLYAVAVRTLERRKKLYWGPLRRPDAVVYHGGALLQMYQGAFRELRRIVDAPAGPIGEDGLAALADTLRRRLDDAFLAEVDGHLRTLRFQAGISVSARLGVGHVGTGYVLERPERGRPPPLSRLVRWWRARGGRASPEFTYRLPPHDDSGVRALAELQARGLERAANAIAGACDDLLWFFRQLRGELALYVGGINLHERLAALGAPICFPEPLDAASGVRQARNLVDPSLALTVARPVVGNDLDADGMRLVVVTGANQGGKTTFLRSVGCAQLMLQSGLFVAAGAYRAGVATGVFTHFTREEDASMRRGRLDDELARMNEVVAALRPGGLLLLNESFASTNEHEGSELAAGIVAALVESGVGVLFVTHLSRFADELHRARRPDALFVRAERLEDGTRTFRILEGAPTRTSHGVDLYRAVFEGQGDAAPARAAGDRPPPA